MAVSSMCAWAAGRWDRARHALLLQMVLDGCHAIHTHNVDHKSFCWRSGSDDELDERPVVPTADSELYKLSLPSEVNATPQASVEDSVHSVFSSTTAMHKWYNIAKVGATPHQILLSRMYPNSILLESACPGTRSFCVCCLASIYHINGCHACDGPTNLLAVSAGGHHWPCIA